MKNGQRFIRAVLLTAGFSVFGLANQAAAIPVILSPTTGVIDIGGPGFGSLDDTRDQSGLSAGFTSGVTGFDAYLAGNPTHTSIFSGFEWFSNVGTTSARVTYGLGSLYSVSALALWNEESSGIGLLNLSFSTDGVTFVPFFAAAPFDNPLADYPAERFNFAPINATHIRFDMSGCPQPNPGSFRACAIGEVAFRVEPANVPEPGLIALVGLGLAGVVRRRRLASRE